MGVRKWVEFERVKVEGKEREGIQQEEV